MSVLNTSVQMTDLDFDTIKTSLKEFLEQQDTFSGYDFEGSGLGVLLNLLAYNTSITAYLAAMLGNEAFLDTAELRSSVVSRAKELGYTPRSVTAPTATISLTITPTTNLTSLIIPKETVFNTTIDGSTYKFSPETDYIAVKSGNTFSVSSMNIKEGSWKQISYVMDSQNADQRFIIPTKNADTSTLLVTIQESTTNTTQTSYTKSTDITTLTASSTAFFLEENEDGYPEIRFGDGTIGKSPHDGNVIILEYLITNDADANGASSFTLGSTIAGDSAGSITVSSSASGGATFENIESVRLLAPRYYQSQNRAVTATDYETIIAQNFPFIDAVRVWGGEDGDPRTTNGDPAYGKVFISIRPAAGYTVTDSMKSNILTSILGAKNLVTVIPEFIDPEYLFIIPAVSISYDASKTNRNTAEITNLVTNTILDFADTNLANFSDTFRYSKLLSAIDNSESAINGSLVSIKIRKNITPVPGVPTEYSIKFENALLHPSNNYPSSISSTSFTYLDNTTNTNVTAYLQEKNGIVQIYKIQDSTKVVITDNAGTINYTTGKIVLSNFNPVSVTNTTLEITATPASNNIAPSKNTLLSINSGDITITTTAE